MGFVSQLGGGDRTTRIRHEWEHITANGGSILLDALTHVPPGIPVLPALLQANLVSSESLTLEQDRAYRQVLAEVYSTPDPAGILLGDVANRLRPTLARTFAHRDEREHPIRADYVAADLQLLISEQWAHGMQQHDYRRSSAHIIRGMATALHDLTMGIRYGKSKRKASQWAHAEVIDLRAELEDYIGHRQPQPEGTWRPAQAEEKTRYVRPTAPYVRQGRSRNLRSYVQASAAMLMATARDAEARRKQRIAAGLRHCRKLASLTQQELADQAEMPRERVVEYEGALHTPGADKLERFARVLGVEAWEFEAIGARQEAGEC